MAPVGLNMAEHFRLPQRMILGGLKGGLKIPRHPNHLNFIDEFKGLVRDPVRSGPASCADSLKRRETTGKSIIFGAIHRTAAAETRRIPR